MPETTDWILPSLQDMYKGIAEVSCTLKWLLPFMDWPQSLTQKKKQTNKQQQQRNFRGCINESQQWDKKEDQCVIDGKVAIFWRIFHLKLFNNRPHLIQCILLPLG